MKIFSVSSLFPWLLWACWAPFATSAQTTVTSWVDPFIGTAAHGHTHPAATMPFGMVQLGPDTRTSMMDWDACSGYHYSDTTIYGFSHTHLSGTGIPDYCDILVTPFVGKTELEPEQYKSAFDKKTESAAPGYYGVTLSKNNIHCEMTATERTGVHRYTFPQNRELARLLVDLRHRDQVLESGMTVVSDREIEGYRISKSWAERQAIYFVMRFSRSFSNSNVLDLSQSPQVSAATIDSRAVAGVFHFYHDGEPLIVTVGISGTSIEGARRNLMAECPGFEFDSIRQKASEAWATTLGKVAVEGGTIAQQRTFYTALYHAMLAPNIWSDVDQQYRGRDGKNHQANHNVYTVFSLWDTYRAANPLHALLEPGRMRDFIKTFLLQFHDGGMLPVWELSGNETNCMIGNHAIPVILDAVTKGLVDENDYPELLKAMLYSADFDRLGLQQYREKGYVPSDEEPESVSKTLEYAYDDWCISRMADKMALPDIADRFLQRSQHFANLFDPAAGFFRGKANGTWRKPFDPLEVNFNYTEGNAWHYRFSVQQNIPALISLLGGKEAFAAQLDALFSQPAATTGRTQADITGLIGQYAQGNEPCHHVAYLYNAVQQPWKTQARVREIMGQLYSDRPDGLCGNDDCGQMSAWYVWSALGFYPVTPGSANYAIGSPMFNKATIHLSEGKQFVVNSAPAFPYIIEAQLNGKKWPSTAISHEQLTAGGEIVFSTGSHPGEWGRQETTGKTPALKIIPVPFVASGDRVFRNKQMITLGCAETGAAIFYRLNNGKEQKYDGPIAIAQSTTIDFYARRNGKESARETAKFTKKSNDLHVVSYAHPYSPQFTGGGNDGLTDLLDGGADFRSGGWQGFEGVDVDVVLDLGKKQTVKKVAANFVQDENSWIFLPVKITVEVSDDGEHFRPANEVLNDIAPETKGVVQKNFVVALSDTQARYLRVRGVNMGKCPPSHKGAGYAAWIFVDEIRVE
jgi:predicted alpha-1,2-mannosidase